MQARLSLSQPTPKVQAARRNARTEPSHGHARHLHDLIRTGIITHRFKSPERLDLMFATGALYDLPEITFVAAFKFGTLYIGCPNGPPDSLEDLLEPISPAHAPETKTELHNGFERMERMTMRLEKAVQAMHSKDVLRPLQHSTEETDPAHDQPPERSQDSMENITQMNAPSFPDANTAEDVQLHRNETLEQGVMPAPDPAPNPEGHDHSGTPHEDVLDATFREETPETSKTQSEETKEEKVGNDAPAKPTEQPPLTPRHPPNENGFSLSDLSGTLSDIAEGIAEIRTRQSEQDALMTGLSNTLTELGTAKIDATPQNQTQHMTDELAALSSLARTAVPEVMRGLSTLSTLHEHITQSAASAKNNVDTTQFADALHRIESKLQSIDTQTQSAAEQTRDHATTLATTQKQYEAVPEKLHGLAQQITALSGDKDVVERIDALGVQIKDLSDTFSAAPQPLETIEKSLGDLRQDVKRLATVPKPVLDLTEQRKSFAIFTTAVSAITQRLESTADQIGKHLENDENAKTADALLKRLDELPAHIKDDVPAPFDFTEITTRLDTLDAENTKTKETLERIDPRLEAMQSDGAEIKALIAVFADKLATNEPAPVDFDPVLEKLDKLYVPTQQVADDIAAVQSSIAQIANRAPQTLDLTAQREGFARFATASSAIVRRLEDCADRLQSLHSEAQPKTQDVTPQLQTLTQEVQKLAQDVKDGPDSHEVLTQLQGDLNALPTVLGELEAMGGTMKTLAKRPDPVIDLTEQRNSFARFMAVMSASMQRLENMATSIADSTAEEDNNTPILNGLQKLQSQIDHLTTVHSDQLTELAQHIASLGNNAASHTSKPTDESAQTSVAGSDDLSAEELRFLFAELIANQIQNTTNPD